jgi:hypothetical protein
MNAHHYSAAPRAQRGIQVFPALYRNQLEDLIWVEGRDQKRIVVISSAVPENLADDPGRGPVPESVGQVETNRASSWTVKEKEQVSE